MTKCGFCKTEGHNIRTCNSPGLQAHIQFIQVNLQNTTEYLLLRYLSGCSTETLSLIMVFVYRASKSTMNKRDKILFIRDKWRIANAVTAPAPQQAPAPQAPAPAAQQAPIPVVDHNQICQTAADRIYRQICIREWDIAIISQENVEEIEDLIGPFILHLAREIVRVSGNNYTYSRSISEKLVRLLCLEQETQYNIMEFLRTAVPAEHIRVARIPIAPPVQAPAGQLVQVGGGQLANYKPKFVKIELCSTVANTINEFTCGICADDLSKQTMPILGCNHALCSDCIIGQIKARAKSFICCPFCRKEVTEIAVIDDKVRNNIKTFMSTEV